MNESNRVCVHTLPQFPALKLGMHRTSTRMRAPACLGSKPSISGGCAAVGDFFRAMRDQSELIASQHGNLANTSLARAGTGRGFLPL